MTSKFEMEGIQDCVVLSYVGNKNVNYTTQVLRGCQGKFCFMNQFSTKKKNNSLMILFAVLLPGLMDNCFVKVL